MTATPKSISEIVLDRVECYDASELNCYAFRRGTDAIGNVSLRLGNMNDCPFTIGSVAFHNSEAAYICGLFSNDTPRHRDIQGELMANTNGLSAKRGIRRPNADCQRKDWEEFNIEWMKFVVWQKVIGNADFQRLLLAIPTDAVIIEDSTFQRGRTAEIWGTRNLCQKALTKAYKAQLLAMGMNKAAIKRAIDAKRLGEWRHQGCFVGKNFMGKILMLCKRALENGTEPDINYSLLRTKRIHLNGELMTFDRFTAVA